jgi:ATP-dependent protease ClpP protease subunit
MSTPLIQPQTITIPLQSIRAPVKLATYVSFSAEINASTTESLLAVMAQLVNNRVEDVHLLMSTPGGNVMNGMNLYNVLRALPLKLTTHNVGDVDSIGNAVFLAGGTRYACPHSTFMFHGVGLDTGPGSRLEEKNLREALDGVLANQKRIASVMSERSNITTEVAETLFGTAQTKDATYAASCGIIHEIRDVQIPPGAPVVTLVFQR